MAKVLNEPVGIIRTERGLTISGTRITLYDIMDYLKAQYPRQFIRGILYLSDDQINAALSYIETHRDQVEAEYKLVIQENEEVRQYWAKENKELLARIAAKPPKPGTEAIRAKLKQAKIGSLDS